MTTPPDTKLRKAVAQISNRLYEKGLVAGASGNVSARKPGSDEVFITPSGICKGYLRTRDVLKVNLEGEVLEGKLKPTSETPLHTRIYEIRNDVNGIVHTHSPMATVLSCLHASIDSSIHPEILVMLGEIRLVEYATPTTNELADAVGRYAKDYDCLMLENHGPITFGSNLEQAYQRAELLEEFALITVFTNILGGAHRLPQAEVDKLLKLPALRYRKEILEKP